MLTYDVTRLETFLNLEHWLTEVNQNIDPNVVKVLVGNMIDKNDKRQVTK